MISYIILNPSIGKIKGRMDVKDKFSFLLVNEDSMKNKIKYLHISKPTTYNNIPGKILVDNVGVCTPYVTKSYNDSVRSSIFPKTLKWRISLQHTRRKKGF